MKKNKKVSNPRIQVERNTLYKVLHLVEKIEEKELPEGSVTNPGWTEFEQGKDHAYETVIYNITLMMEKLDKEEENWKGGNSSQD